MHRAPVVGLVVLDGRGAPLPEPLEVAHDLARSPDMQGSHQLLVISEEQLKVRKDMILCCCHVSPWGNSKQSTPIKCRKVFPTNTVVQSLR